MQELKLFSGSSNPELAKKIAARVGVKLGDSEVKKFSDGETWVEVNESVRGSQAFVIQSTCTPVNDNLMELLIMIDALHRAAASKVIAVVPYMGYARQDRKTAPREPISAKLVANLLQASGVNQLMCLDLHSGQMQGFFDVPVDNLTAQPIMQEHIQKNGFKDVVIVSPDAGGVKRAQKFVDRLGAKLALIYKKRSKPNESVLTHVVGDVQGKTAVLLDDMIDTGGSIANAANALEKMGAKKVLAYCTHAILSGDAVKKIDDSALEKLVVTDSIPVKAKSKKIEVLTVADLLGDAIKANYENRSVSSLFKAKGEK